MNDMRARICLALLGLLAIFAAIPSAQAQEWQRFRLGEASFEVPKDWKIVRRAREREYTLKSPDGAYELRVEWWLADEPLLGFSDIVWHRKVTVAGEPALMIHSKFPQSETLQVALDRKRKDGRQLLIVLETQGKSLKGGSPVLDDILQRLTLGRDGKSAPPATGKSGALAPPPSQGNSPAGLQPKTPRTPATQGGPPRPPEPSRSAVHEDAANQIRVRYPANWSRSTADRDGLSILTLAPPDKQGLVLVVAARGEGTRTAKALIAAYEEQYYQDYVIPDFIEGDGDTSIGAMRGHYVDMQAQVYPVEGVRTGFSDGRSWLWKAEAEPVSYIVAVIHARNAPAALVKELKAVANGIAFGPIAATPPAVAATEPPPPTQTPQAPASAADAAATTLQAGATSSPFGADCESVDAAGWRHPMRAALQAKGRAVLEWVSLCRGSASPVLGVAFELDPQGATADYFNPLYLALLEANGRRPFLLVSTRDSVAITVGPIADGGFAIDVAQVAGADADAFVRGGDGPPVDTATDSGAPVDGAADTGAVAQPQGVVTLFSGGMSEDWLPISMSGGDFKKFARFESGALLVDVPAGNVWGKTGLASARPVVTIPDPQSEEAIALRFTIDAARAKNFAISLLPAGKGSEDEWHRHQVRFAITTKEGEAPELILWVEREERGRRRLDDGIPAEIELQMMPDRVMLITDGAGNILLQGTLPDELAVEGYHIQAIAHARDRDGPASLALQRITRQSWAFGRVVAGDRTLQPGETQTTALFDGEVAHPALQRYQAHGGDFAKHAKIDGGALVVETPERAKWGKSGFFSREPLIWHDGLGEDGETVTTFAFDPARTTGFVAALSPVSGLKGNDPSNPKMLVHWRQTADGKALYSIYSGYDKLADVTPETSDAPRHVKIVLRQGRAKFVLPGARDFDIAWPPAATGQGFRPYVYSHPDKADMPVRMALTGIIVERSAGEPLAQIGREHAPAMLPERVLFDGGKPGAWDIAAIADELKAFARIEGGRLLVDVPEKKNQWAKSGVLFRELVVDLNERIQSTSLKFTLRFDPKATDGVQIIFSPRLIANMWDSRRASISLIRAREGPNAGRYMLGIDADVYRTWGRGIDAAWMDANWDGTLEIEIVDGGIIARVPGAATVRGTDLQLRKGAQLHMVVTAHPEKPYGPARMGLVSASSQWQLPTGADTLGRWSYVDDADFKPDTFLDELTRSLDGAGTTAAALPQTGANP